MGPSMKWYRVKPGLYELRRSGTPVAVIERSSAWPMWWWCSWVDVGCGDMASSLSDAKLQAYSAVVRTS